jgi:hypothetical protein
MFHEIENHITRSKMSYREMVRKMTREDIINIMIDTVNTHNANFARQNGMSDQQIADAIVEQRQSFEYMFGLVYDDLAAAGVLI